MRLNEAIKVLRRDTMACWWPSPVMGREGTDFGGIFEEAAYLQLGMRRRQDIPDGESFYVLDPANPESAMHDELGCAVMVVKQAIRNS